mmetsp:Transcript_26986/g.57224  ORF Transcript_26986/g.57224 Transcript_26986/m.57224 type:complete len:365 (-) Transcript_26986:33-1127(-)
MSLEAEKQSALLQKLKEDPSLCNTKEDEAFRFLKHSKFDVEKAFGLIQTDYKWRQQMKLDELTVAHVQDQLRTEKFMFTGAMDKKGRPIIYFNAAKHNPKDDFLETLKLAVYSFELVVKNMPEGVEELLIVENLDGFTKENADTRMVKYLLEITQAHYPCRIGSFVGVNAPWYYQVLFKIVKPWMSDDLLSKVNIFTNAEKLPNFVEKNQILESLGGTLKFNVEEWIAKRSAIENVDLANPPPFTFSPEILAAFSDYPVSTVTKSAKISGWIKKQGGYVRNFNKRYCVLTDTVLYYYKTQDGQKPEGFVELYNATITKGNKENVFCITTATFKHCYFSVSTKSFPKWYSMIKESIEMLSIPNSD